MNAAGKACHELKTLPVPYQQVVDGEKTFEYRKDDRGFEVGDYLDLREYGTDMRYTGRRAFVLVSSILRGGAFGVPEGYCVMSIVLLATGVY